MAVHRREPLPDPPPDNVVLRQLADPDSEYWKWIHERSVSLIMGQVEPLPPVNITEKVAWQAIARSVMQLQREWHNWNVTPQKPEPDHHAGIKPEDRYG